MKGLTPRKKRLTQNIKIINQRGGTTPPFLKKGEIMTVNDVIDRVNKLKDNAMDNTLIKGFIEDVDKRIFKEVIETHEDPVTTQTYSERYPLNNISELLAPDEYAQFYEHYTIAQIDFFNGEYDRYNNNMYRYNSALHDYKAFYNRTHMPKGVRYLTTD